MKKLSILFLLTILFLTGCTKNEPKDTLELIKAKDKIVVGIKDNSKPFAYEQNGEFKGFDVDIAKCVSSRLFHDANNHLELVPLKPSERISALNTGRVDIVIATLSINDRRKEIISFSDPYYIAGQALMVPSSSKISTIYQLNDKAVTIVLGTTGEKTVRMLAPNATIIGATNYKEAFDYLKNGTVQAILADDSLLYGLLIDNKGFKILPQRYTKEYYAIGIRQGEENLNLTKQLNVILKTLQQTGRLERIRDKWIPDVKIRH